MEIVGKSLGRIPNSEIGQQVKFLTQTVFCFVISSAGGDEFISRGHISSLLSNTRDNCTVVTRKMTKHVLSRDGPLCASQFLCSINLVVISRHLLSRFLENSFPIPAFIRVTREGRNFVSRLIESVICEILK